MSKIDELKKHHERAKSSILTAEMSHTRHLANIREDFRRKYDEILAGIFDKVESLLSYTSKMQKRADDKHYKAMCEIAPIREKAVALTSEAKELEALTFEL